jgi:hypothetical protein
MKVEMGDLRAIAKSLGDGTDFDGMQADSYLHEFFDSLSLMEFLLVIGETLRIDTSGVEVTSRNSVRDLLEQLTELCRGPEGPSG